jgi:oligopeptide/dipeptide ABC transporter ATP-binding protein
MYLGLLVEEGPAAEVMTAPRHPYTRMLLDAVPVFDPADRAARGDRGEVRGDPPSPTEKHVGCPFVSRCPFRTEVCDEVRPEPRDVGGVTVRCHHAEQVSPVT